MFFVTMFAGGLAAFALLAVLWALIAYNRIVALDQTASQAWGDVDVQLKQRHDLIPNLVATVKGYASHEAGTLDQVIRARNSAIGAAAPDAKAASEEQLSSALRQIFALKEAYPDLKANEGFQQLQGQLSQLENQISAARRFFNNAVAEYNATVRSIPAVFFAGAAGFAPRKFFEVAVADRDAVEAAPAVQF